MRWAAASLAGIVMLWLVRVIWRHLEAVANDWPGLPIERRKVGPSRRPKSRPRGWGRGASYRQRSRCNASWWKR